MRRDQPTTPFDVEADDVTQEFWGASKSWVSSEQPTVRRRAGSPTGRNDDTTGSLRVIRDGFAAFRPQTSANATGEIRRQRQHGAPSRSTPAPASPARREATLGELAAGRTHADGFDDDYLDDDYLDLHDHDRPRPAHRELEAGYDVPLTPIQPLVERLGLGAVDPLLVRAGVFVLALILLVPVVLSLRPDRADSLPGAVVEAPQPVVAGAAPAPAETPQTLSAPAVEPSAPAAPATVAPTAAPETVSSPEPTQPSTSAAEAAASETAPPSTAGDPPQSEPSVDLDAAAVDVAAERIVPACPQTYTAAPGDSWYRIADAAGVTPAQLLAENNATTDTVILPGDDICLPDGAAMPTPPTTVAPSTTTAPTTTAPPTTAAPTTAPPTTAAPTANLSRAEVQELIRQTWPADEVEKALAVARRESNFVATADNGWCCVGVFQIYWTVHRGWLDDFGIYERSDLFDARKNIAAAYSMWQRSGWGPWGG